MGGAAKSSTWELHRPLAVNHSQPMSHRYHCIMVVVVVVVVVVAVSR